jgi:hypothetical protein
MRLGGLESNVQTINTRLDNVDIRLGNLESDVKNIKTDINDIVVLNNLKRSNTNT